MVKDKSNIFPNLPTRLIGLADVDTNLWWSWHPEARMLFKKLDRLPWKSSGHNPAKMLRELPRKKLEWSARDPEYLRHYDVVYAKFQKEMEAKDCWHTENFAELENLTIAYFSAEYGLHHSYPFYASGLGFLAGDYIKECSDLRVPLVAIGFMYPEGYVRQRIREDGWQDSMDEILDRDAASITRVLKENGQQLRVKSSLY